MEIHPARHRGILKKQHLYFVPQLSEISQSFGESTRVCSTATVTLAASGFHSAGKQLTLQPAAAEDRCGYNAS